MPEFTVSAARGRRRIVQQPERPCLASDWAWWRCWYPVRLSSGWTWLSWVQRRRAVFQHHTTWEYR